MTTAIDTMETTNENLKALVESRAVIAEAVATLERKRKPMTEREALRRRALLDVSARLREMCKAEQAAFDSAAATGLTGHDVTTLDAITRKVFCGKLAMVVEDYPTLECEEQTQAANEHTFEELEGTLRGFHERWIAEGM